MLNLSETRAAGDDAQGSYDPMGRVVNYWSCSPSTCGTPYQASRPLSFAFDWVGNLTMETDNASGSISYARTVAGEVSSITNETYQNAPYNPENLASNVVNGPFGPVSYTLGNGLNVARTYDIRGRLDGMWVCNGPAAVTCSGGTQVYGMANTRVGANVLHQDDTVLGQQVTFSYGDGLNELTARTVTSGTQQNYSYNYDVWGNRVQQTPTAGSGYTFNATIDPATNRITSFGYDAAGNVINDLNHTYTYDAEGNITTVDGGSTAQYVYDALNRRVHVQTASGSQDFLYDYAGRRISTWTSPTFASEGRIFWDKMQFGFRAIDGTTYFDHQDTLGTERMRTNYSGGIAATYASLPWGDGYSETVNNAGGDQDNNHFSWLERDAESDTEHAQFRNYSSSPGRWMSPDPDLGSYDFTNPRSFNRYTYVLNNPVSFNDSTGLTCVGQEGLPADDGDGQGCEPAGILPGDPNDPDRFIDPDSVTSTPPAQGTDLLYNSAVAQAQQYLQGQQLQSTNIFSAPSKPGCSTVLPNGKTLGQYINQGRAQMQASKTPLLTFASIARDYGQIDFKNGAGGRSVLATNLGQDGNFAYYAIGSGFLSPNTLDFGASVYAVAATVPYPGHSGKPFSTIGNGPMLIDDSAASMRSAGLATPGCPQ